MCVCVFLCEYQDMYISYCIKNLNVQQIYLYNININIHLGLSSGLSSMFLIIFIPYSLLIE